MSWSFSVYEETPADAQRVFKNLINENEQHIPNSVANALIGAAGELTYHAKRNQPCAISTSGHFNGDGTGNADLRVVVKAASEWVPPNVGRNPEPEPEPSNVPVESLGRDPD